jgi:hypothetical protein
MQQTLFLSTSRSFVVKKETLETLESLTEKQKKKKKDFFFKQILYIYL